MATRIGPLQRVSNYVGNVKKETVELAKAYLKATEAQNEVGPGANQASARANKKQQEAQGQFLGALLQGRRYDNKGRQR